MKKILYIIGSLRKGSFNRKLAEEAERMMDGRAFIGFISAYLFSIFVTNSESSFNDGYPRKSQIL